MRDDCARASAGGLVGLPFFIRSVEGGAHINVLEVHPGASLDEEADAFCKSPKFQLGIANLQ